jgi:hypothetical protein
MMSLEEKHELEEFCDARYVRKDDCTERRENFDKKLAKDDKRIEIIAHDFGVLKKLLWLIASACAAEVVVLLFDIFTK